MAAVDALQGHGTTLAAQLRKEGFGGVICLLSASPDELARPQLQIDVVWRKGSDLRKLAATLRQLREVRQLRGWPA